MGQGGQRPGAGRPAGARNKRTLAAEVKAREVAAVIEHALDEPFLGDAHALLVAIYKDPAQPIELRIEAAGKAIRFEKPILASIEVQAEGMVRHVISAEPLPPEERDREWLAQHGAKLQ